MSQYTAQSEFRDICPLIQNSLIEAKGNRYRVDRWFTENGHCYEFFSVGEDYVQPFIKKPSEVSDLIKRKVITIIKI